MRERVGMFIWGETPVTGNFACYGMVGPFESVLYTARGVFTHVLIYCKLYYFFIQREGSKRPASSLVLHRAHRTVLAPIIDTAPPTGPMGLRTQFDKIELALVLTLK